MSKQNYAPWRDDERAACWLLAAGVGAGTLATAALAIGGGSASVYLGFALTAALLLRAVRSFESARRRKYGKELERIYIVKLEALLRQNRLHHRKNVMMPGLGDIDLIVEAENGPVTIEIKSFVRWRALFGFFHGGRERAALDQATRQVCRARARAGLVWLPTGKPTLLQRFFPPRKSGVKVVFGGPKAVLRALRSG